MITLSYPGVFFGVYFWKFKENPTIRYSGAKKVFWEIFALHLEKEFRRKFGNLLKQACEDLLSPRPQQDLNIFYTNNDIFGIEITLMSLLANPGNFQQLTIGNIIKFLSFKNVTWDSFQYLTIYHVIIDNFDKWLITRLQIFKVISSWFYTNYYSKWRRWYYFSFLWWKVLNIWIKRTGNWFCNSNILKQIKNTPEVSRF